MAESLALVAWKRRERIELLRTIAIVTAQVNPEKASQALSKLIEEMFPEHKIDREKAVDRAMEIMEREKDRVYNVSKVGQRTKNTPLARIQGILGKKRGTKR